MLVRFELENWMSFKDSIEFSMVASQEQQHGSRLPKSKKYRMRVLPVAAIYGGNASGKSNFFQAMWFAKEFIVKGSQPDSPIHVEPFLLDPAISKDTPSRFSFEILVDNMVYEYSFSACPKKVHHEKLVQIFSTSEKVLFSRKGDKIKFHPSLAKDDLLKFSFRGTRDNQLFLTNSVSQKVERFEPIYRWFRDTLVLIAPDMRFGQIEKFIEEDSPLFETMDKLLSSLDTGIVNLRGKEVPFEDLPFYSILKKEIRENIKEGTPLQITDSFSNDRIVATLKNDEIVTKKLTATHRGRNGYETQFEMSNESDGSLRVIDLLPAFLDLADPNSEKIYLIDELDRSLHTLLTRQLLDVFLDSCSEDSRSQLLFTTHDLMTMDQNLLRRDEMWVVERNAYGESSMISFNEYKEIRSDKDILKSYLQGRLGGIPHLFASDRLLQSTMSTGEGE